MDLRNILPSEEWTDTRDPLLHDSIYMKFPE